MKWPGSWRVGALQLGLLAGVGLGLVGAEPAAAPVPCGLEGACTFKKPRLMFVLEYATAMNQSFAADTTRWEQAVATVAAMVAADNGYVAENFLLGLSRYGSDPDPDAPDTAIDGDGTGLRDGVALDVGWYDPLDPDKQYVECSQGDTIVAALAGLPAPVTGIGTWTRGALAFVKAYVAAADGQHPQDLGKRRTAVMLLTAGIWTDAVGSKKLGPAGEHPKLAAAELSAMGVPTYVVNLGGVAGKLVSDPLAKAGGTGTVLAGDDAAAGVASLKQVVVQAQADVVAPVCEVDLPRVMFVVDASSSMLNVDGVHAKPGLGLWDQMRDSIAGSNSAFDIVVGEDNRVEEVFRVGMTVFGGQGPGEPKLVRQYGPCPHEPLKWALDPGSSCEPPGCFDVYDAPPIVWTTKNGKLEIGLDADTFSHMPRCDVDAMQPGACGGSGRYLHLGLELVADNLATYRAGCLAPDSASPCDAETEFFNILITDGSYDSTDAQVQARLVALVNAGVVTRVIGFGPAVDPVQLAAMASWGSDGLQAPIVAPTQDALMEALDGLFPAPALDPCCVFDDCEHSSWDDTLNGDDEIGDVTGVDWSSSTGGGGSSGAMGSTAPGMTSTSGESGVSGEESGAGSTTGAPEVPTGSSGGGSGGPTTDGSGPTPSSGGPETGSASSGPGEEAADEGCACATRAPRGVGGLLWFGLVGLFLRRRS